MHVKLYLQISPDYLACVRPGSGDFAERLLTWASFSTTKLASYIQLGEAELDIDVLTDPAQIAVAGAAALRIKQADIRAKAQKECNDVEKVINQLLAIENKPTAPAAPTLTDEDVRLTAVAFDHGYDIRKDTDSDYYIWSARSFVEDSAATYDTPADAARGLFDHLGLDEEGLPKPGA